jgi:hypothetical protein
MIGNEFATYAPCQSLGKRFKVQWLLYVPPALTYQNSAFCLHSVICDFHTVLGVISGCVPQTAVTC